MEDYVTEVCKEECLIVPIESKRDAKRVAKKRGYSVKTIEKYLDCVNEIEGFLFRR